MTLPNPACKPCTVTVKNTGRPCERRTVRGKDVCASHGGVPKRAPRPPLPIGPRFWRRVRIGSTCWEWQGALNRKGYGEMYNPGGERIAHRLAWTLRHGPIPAGLLVCHHCDNRRCVRPSHLFLGTARDNRLDMDRKGRARPARGERVNTAKLTADQVVLIRERCARGETFASVARDFGVAETLIPRIYRRDVWKHVA